MAFPENDVSVLPRYFPVTPIKEAADKLPGSGAAIPQVEAFVGEIALTDVQRSQQQRALAVQDARRRLRPLLDVGEATVTHMETVTDLMTKRNFPDAEKNVGMFPPPQGTVQRLERAAIVRALTPSAVSFFDIEVEIKFPDTPFEKEIVKRVPKSLKGYDGTAPDASFTDEELTEFYDFLEGRPTRRFRLGLLRGDVLMGLRRFDDAAQEYERLIENPDGLSKTQLKCVALRAGAPHPGARRCDLPVGPDPKR
jgi:hypothetical protein